VTLPRGRWIRRPGAVTPGQPCGSPSPQARATTGPTTRQVGDQRVGRRTLRPRPRSQTYSASMQSDVPPRCRRILHRRRGSRCPVSPVFCPLCPYVSVVSMWRCPVTHTTTFVWRTVISGHDPELSVRATQLAWSDKRPPDLSGPPSHTPDERSHMTAHGLHPHARESKTTSIRYLAEDPVRPRGRTA
jgi:hypothetical protein